MLGRDRVRTLACQLYLGDQLALAFRRLACKHRLTQGGAVKRNVRAGTEIAVGFVLTTTVTVRSLHICCLGTIQYSEAGGVTRLIAKLLEYWPRTGSPSNQSQDRMADIGGRAREPILAAIVLLQPTLNRERQRVAVGG